MLSFSSATLDPSHDLSGRRSDLAPFFAPKSVAIIGASETPGSVGRTLLWNLLSSPFGGTVYPVNPRRPSVLGIRAYPSIREVPERPDLAVICTPAPGVPALVRECVEAGVPCAIIISAGFKETGAAGVELERQIQEIARGKMRIIGPNCLGVMSPLSGLNATFAARMAKPGRVACLSQSGALLTAILDTSLQEEFGFSAFVSLGSMLDVGWGNLISYPGDDPRTESILIYMESVGDARAFLSAAREVALSKPIIVIKAGRTGAAAQAAASHTGTLAGSDDVLDAAFKRCGVLRVDRIAELFSTAEVLAKQPTPRGNRLMIVTNAGGPGVLATDALLGGDGELATLSAATMTELDAVLPAPWSHGNPVDVLGGAGPERYAQAVEIVAKEDEADALLVILTPQAMTDSTLTAQALKPYAKTAGKPILAAWMGGADVEAGRAILRRAEIPDFLYPDAAVRAFNLLWRYSDNLRLLYETPSLPAPGDGDAPDSAGAARLIESVRASGCTLLTEAESKELLLLYRIPTVPTRVATTPTEAATFAREQGSPSVLKLHSFTVTHKTDVGGVKLGLENENDVRRAFGEIQTSLANALGENAAREAFAGVSVQPMVKLDGYELIVGCSPDAQFGPVLLFGSGGQLVEIYKDSALALPPLNSTLARRMMEQTRIFSALQGVRGRAPVDIGALEQLLVRFSTLVVEQSRIKELDINPLVASPDGLIALDARVVLHDFQIADSDLPRPAIRPYPTQYIGRETLRDETVLSVRPIRPEDEPLLAAFHGQLGSDTVYARYFQPLELGRRIEHERLVRQCFNDYDREIALVAESDGRLWGVARLVRDKSDAAEFALLIADFAQRRGLGTCLLQRLLEVARAEGVARVTAEILPSNAGMQRVCAALGFALSCPIGQDVVQAQITL